MYIIIVGGGKVGYYLTKALSQEGHEVLLIERDPRRVAQLTEELGELVMLGYGDELRTLEQAGAARADAIVAVTGGDEDNLVICQIARKRYHIPRVIARVNFPKNRILFERFGIEHVVSSTEAILMMIEQQIPAGHIIPLAALKQGNLEIIEIDLDEESPAANRTLSELALPPGTSVMSILRGGQALVPQADTRLAVGDTVIALVQSDRQEEMRRAFMSA
ncbi:MAG: potassium channel family protein [Armatimonadota bacterium]